MPEYLTMLRWKYRRFVEQQTIRTKRKILLELGLEQSKDGSSREQVM
jgi:hypothetical protein